MSAAIPAWARVCIFNCVYFVSFAFIVLKSSCAGIFFESPDLRNVLDSFTHLNPLPILYFLPPT
jgi:hypothetical protein